MGCVSESCAWADSIGRVNGMAEAINRNVTKIAKDFVFFKFFIFIPYFFLMNITEKYI